MVRSLGVGAGAREQERPRNGLLAAESQRVLSPGQPGRLRRPGAILGLDLLVESQAVATVLAHRAALYQRGAGRRVVALATVVTDQSSHAHVQKSASDVPLVRRTRFPCLGFLVPALRESQVGGSPKLGLPRCARQQLRSWRAAAVRAQ